MTLKVRYGVAALMAVAVSCSSGTEVARDLEVGPDSQRVMFAVPIVVDPGSRSFCLEFTRPGDSDVASQLVVALIDSTGNAEPFRGTPDRAGESAVCLRDSVTTRRVHTGAVLVAPHRLSLRRMTW